MKRHDASYSKNKGFTLVELIVVLVILAILAAILAPTLLGYIDEAKVKRYLPNAQACKDAAQAAFVEQYARNGDVEVGTPVVPDAHEKSTSGNEDQDISKTAFAESVLNYAGMNGNNKPYLFMVAVGSNAKTKGTYEPTSAYDKYTIFYCVYMEKKDTMPLYYYNNEWSTRNPRQKDMTEIFSKENIVKSGPLKGKRLQYYVIANQTGLSVQGSLWKYIKEDVYKK